MNDEKWLDMKADLKMKEYDILEDKTEDYTITTDEGDKKIGTVDIIVCEIPIGRVRLERINKPMILDKKVQYHRKKEGSKIEYIYSDTEFTHHLDAYKWNDNEWQKIETPPMF